MIMKNLAWLKPVAGLAGILFAAAAAHAGDPLTNAWFTSYAGKYARLWSNCRCATLMCSGNLYSPSRCLKVALPRLAA